MTAAPTNGRSESLPGQSGSPREGPLSDEGWSVPVPGTDSPPEGKRRISNTSGSSSKLSGGANGVGPAASDKSNPVAIPTSSGRISQGHSRGLQQKDDSPSKGPRKTIKQELVQSKWYQSSDAKALREVLQGRSFTILMLVALFFALFLPDIWVLAGVNNNIVTDVLLTIVMALFSVELVALSTVDASYFMGFFFFMDIIGTCCMVFDLSYTGLTTNTEPRKISDSDIAKNHAMLLRASRAAKVGARAGRLSRLVRMIKFVSGHKHAASVKSTALGSTISAALANLLATRVAALTILLVMIIPLFDMLTWPSSDYSMRAWTNTLSLEATNGRTQQILDELDMMVDYYSVRGYGPYKACTGTWSNDNFDCTMEYTDWSPIMTAPPRGASEYLVHTNDFMVSFNMHKPIQVEAACSMATMLFILVIMVFSGMALSGVVTELAVRPLEQMLDKVRHIARTVFKFSAEVAEEEVDFEDIDCSNEVKLLERVVEKLAVVAELQTHKNICINEDMRDEDKAVISMMQGQNVEGMTDSSKPFLVQPKKPRVLRVVTIEEHGVLPEVFNSFQFSPLNLTREQRCAIANYCLTTASSGDVFLATTESQATLARFVTACEAEYPANPFHNFSHAVDVVHGTAKMIRLVKAESFLSELEQFSLLVSAVAHDLGHLGVNNAYLSEIGHELAVQYNDKSPLENMHCARLYTIVANKDLGANIFESLSKEQYREARKHCIEIILHTDMVLHMGMVRDLQMIYEMNSEIFKVEANTNESNGAQQAEMEIFRQSNEKATAMKAILHSADVSNPARVWEVTHAWAMIVLEEFFAQGDLEKKQGVPVQFLNNRDTLNRPNSQIGFLEFMIAPFFAAQIRLWPGLSEYGTHLSTNIGLWEEMWVREIGPQDEERGKVRGRVAGVQRNLAMAACRDNPDGNAAS